VSSSDKSGKVPALQVSIPGAAPGWYDVSWLPGLYHPEKAVPCEKAEEYMAAQKQRVADAKKEWDETEKRLEEKGWRRHGRLPFQDPGCPVKLVYITEQTAEANLSEAQNALRESAIARRAA
jgi:hypothetical protein